MNIVSAVDSESCDTCWHQEGRHYCQMWGITLKNMDTIRCEEWRDVWRCPICDGAGWFADGPTDNPYQAQCGTCYGQGYKPGLKSDNAPSDGDGNDNHAQALLTGNEV